MERSPSWDANRFSASQEIPPPHFMEPEGSLQHLQVPATYPFPKPDQSNPWTHIPLPEDPSWYYPPIYACVFQVVSFPQVSPPKPYIHLYSPPNILLSTLFSITISLRSSLSVSDQVSLPYKTTGRTLVHTHNHYVNEISFASQQMFHGDEANSLSFCLTNLTNTLSV